MTGDSIAGVAFAVFLAGLWVASLYWWPWNRRGRMRLGARTAVRVARWARERRERRSQRRWQRSARHDR